MSARVYALCLGIALLIAAAVLNPAVVATLFSPDGVLARSTVIQIHLLRITTIGFGALLLHAGLGRSRLPRHVESVISGHALVIGGVGAVALLLSTPILAYGVYRIGYGASLDFNEGWNAIHLSRWLAGQALYGPISGLPLIPVDYPPLSFWIIGGLSRISGASALLTGRIVALLGLAFVAYLIFLIVVQVTSRRAAGLLAAVLWLAVFARTADSYLGMYDPQLLGQSLSVGALYLFVRWRRDLTTLRTLTLSILCALALWIKQGFIVVPATLALMLLLTNRRAFSVLALGGILSIAVLLSGTWLLSGPNLLTNLATNLAYETSSDKMISAVRGLFVSERFAVFSLPVLVVARARWPEHQSLLLYFFVSALAGVVGSRVAGVAVNIWFDLFIASSLMYGLVAAEVQRRLDWRQIGTYAVLATVLLPLLTGAGAALDSALGYSDLRRRERLCRSDTALLRSIPGPALFEDPLMGFMARKQFLFDPFNGNQLILAGRVPESVLTDPIRSKFFTAIVLTFDLEEHMRSLNGRAVDPARVTASLPTRWTTNVLVTIRDNYSPLRSSGCPHRYFYVPRPG